jgi:hypothetical protein
MKTRLLLLAGLLFCSANAFSQNTNLYVFLCFGQSNMEGYPGIEERDKASVDSRFQVLAAVDFPSQKRTKGNWYTAIPPLCRPSTGLFRKDAGLQSPAKHQGGRRERCRGRLQN